MLESYFSPLIKPHAATHGKQLRDMCDFCLSLINKYKCPKCLNKYCCLSSYKNHTGIYILLIQDSCKSLLLDEKNSEIKIIPREPGELSEDEDGNTSNPLLQEKYLNMLNKSETIKNMIGFSRLRDMLIDVYVSENSRERIKELMADKDFRQFCDECNSALGIKKSRLV
ncbi:hypothetical protein HZS_5890 [Henneguya salminicola]|nr:hypothetical protein HZS_5890 [Henneguya salminicola]